MVSRFEEAGIISAKTTTAIYQKTEAIVQFDILRIAAVIAVVWQHVSVSLVLDRNSTLPQWWAGNIADAPSHWCIPVFAMLSGALLFNDRRPYTARQFYARRATRVLVPLIFWTVFYLAVRRFRDHVGLRDLVKDTVGGVPYFHLWFLYMIPGLYAVAPLLKTLVVNSGRTTLTITVATLLLVASIDRTFSLAMLSAQHGIDAPHTFLVRWLPYTAYFLAGCVFVKWPLRISIAWALACFLICYTLLLIITGYVHQQGWQDPYFAYDDDFNPLVIAASLALFACFSSIPVSCSPGTHVGLRSLADLTLGIYLVHPLWLDALSRVGVDGRLLDPAVGIPLTVVTAFSLSGVTAALIKVTPILRRVI
jgi:surface polysaccharide O-acyltransferase-like enzyme